MTPDLHPTPAEQAVELDVAAKIAQDHSNPVFAQELAQHAHHLRMEHQQEAKNDQLPKN